LKSYRAHKIIAGVEMRTFSSCLTIWLGSVRLRLLIVALGIGLMPVGLAAQSEPTGVAVLMDRVGSPSPEALDEFKNAGMEGVRPHELTAGERAKVEAALDSLPSLNQRVLEKRLRHLAFVDGIPGEGTGLTSPVEKTGMYDITLRTSIVDEPLSKFLTKKERRVFRDDGSGVTVTVTGTGADALTYVLLHESTHVTDFACGITAHPHSPLEVGIWGADKQMVPALAGSMATTTYFRGGKLVPMGQAAMVYDALAKTPFVSLYGTASPMEDFAELVAWYEILTQHHGDLVIAVSDAHGKTPGEWKPLTFPWVQKRFAEVDALLASPSACSSLAS
jgi:hypothetical protein